MSASDNTCKYTAVDLAFEEIFKLLHLNDNLPTSVSSTKLNLYSRQQGYEHLLCRDCDNSAQIGLYGTLPASAIGLHLAGKCWQFCGEYVRDIGTLTSKCTYPEHAHRFQAVNLSVRTEARLCMRVTDEEPCCSIPQLILGAFARELSAWLELV